MKINGTVEVKKSLLTDIDDFDCYYEKDVFVTTINGTSSVEGKNFVYGREINNVDVLPNEGYNKFIIERYCDNDNIEHVSGEFLETELESGEKILAIGVSFSKLKDGTHIYIYCLKDFDDFPKERDKYLEKIRTQF
ncbi:MAG: hypothetical protein LBC84_02225 [Prevotellaceae bacterium]|nr:hypothetical protein [Prevotellaceae bacterium]